MDDLVKRLQEKVNILTQSLDALHGTPCEQIRHQQEIEALADRAEAAEARVRELEARLAAEKHVFFENVPVPACECGMTGPCMWSECKSPMLPSIRALKSDPERG